MKSKKKKTIEFIKGEFEKRGYTLISTEYKRKDKKLEFICPKGHEYFITWDSFRKGSGCLICQKDKKLTYSYVKSKFEERGFDLLSKEYINTNTKLEYKCNRGHINLIDFDHLRSGRGCPDCGYENRRYSFDKVNEFIKKDGATLLNLERKYKSNTTKKHMYITFKCTCGNIESRFFDFSQEYKVQCKKCKYGKRQSKGRSGDYKYTIDDIKNIFPENYILISKEIKSIKDKVTVKCPNFNHKPYYVFLGNLLRGCKCRQCYSENQRGDKHFNWRYDLEEDERVRKRHLIGYSFWRKSVLKKDEYTCQLTGVREDLEVHHINSYSKYRESRLNIDNGITLNRYIHDRFHEVFGRITSKENFEKFKNNWMDYL